MQLRSGLSCPVVSSRFQESAPRTDGAVVACRWRFAFRGFKVVLTPRVRAVGHRKGSKQLLNTSAGLVRTVVRNELTVHGAAPSSVSQRTDDHFEFVRTNELHCKCWDFSMSLFVSCYERRTL